MILRHSRGLLIAALALLAVEGLATAGRLLAIPGDPKNSLLLGLSLSRLLMLAAALGVALAALGLVVALARSARLAVQVERLVDRRAGLLAGMLAALAVGCWLGLALLRADLERNLSAYTRLQPVLLLGFLAGAQGLALLPLWKFGLRRASTGRAGRAGLAAFAALGLLFALMALTGFGVTPDLYAWGPPGVPLLAWQVALVALLGCGVYLLGGWARPGSAAPRGLDLALCVALWALAAGLWLSQPLSPSFFNPPLRAPNFEYYPYSDAGYYDYIAQGLVSGNGYLNGRGVTRPLYILFLGLLHLLGGDDYAALVRLQTLALALLPAALYLLGKAFHSRAAGLMLGGLAILRELNSYAATPLTEVSHAKLLLADLPATLAMVLLVLACARWLQEPRRRWMPLVVGGAAGLMALLRAQSLLVMPFVFLLALFVYRGQFRRLVEAGLLALLGLALALGPWVARNAMNGNGFSIDQAGNQVVIFAQRYSDQVQRWPPRAEGESEAAYSRRLMALAREFAIQHPGYVAGFIGAHFLNNLADAAAVLPVQISFDDARDNWTLDSLFWKGMLPALPEESVRLLFLNVTLIALGIGACRARWGAAGLLPLAVLVGYSLSNAIARNSGWRYILPVDWVGYFYAVTGMLALLAWVLALLGRTGVEPGRQPVESSAAGRFPWRRALLVGLAFLLAGSMVPLAEYLFPRRYPVMEKAALAEMLLASPGVRNSGVDLEALRGFLQSDGTVLLRGQALYPRFYHSGQGELGNGWPGYAMREGSRLSFLLLQPAGPRQAILWLDKAPKAFPNAAETLVAGCASPEGYVQVLLAVLPGSKERVYWHGMQGPYSCPLP